MPTETALAHKPVPASEKSIYPIELMFLLRVATNILEEARDTAEKRISFIDAPSLEEFFRK